MPWPFPSEGDVEDEFRFMLNRREVIIFARDEQDAKTKFQKRFGFWPTDENRAD